MITSEVKRPFAPWITADIRSLIHRRNCAQSSLKENRNNTELQTSYKNLKREVKTALHRARSDYYSKNLEDCKGNGRETWRILKELVPDAKKNIMLPVRDDDDDEESTKCQAEISINSSVRLEAKPLRNHVKA